jgi:hypothetical protein
MLNARKLPIDRRVRIVRLYSECGENASETVRLFQEEFPDDSMSVPTVIRINRNFDETGDVKDRARSGRPRTGRSEENQFDVAIRIVQSPEKSTRQMSAETGIPPTTVRRILKKDLNLRSYIPQMVPELIDDDGDRRVQFAEEWIRQMNNNPDFWKLVSWSDEAIFKLNGHVNRHNNVTWTDTNPRRVIDRPFQSPGVMVWAGVLNDRLIGPFFFDDQTITGDRYLEMLQNEMWPEIADHSDIDSIFFQQDGAPPDYKLNVREWLDETFGGRWIGRRGLIEWPPRSPDMTPLDFWLWGYLKQLVYAHKPRTINELKQLIREKMNEILPEMIAYVCESVTRRMQRCIELNGAQITG